MPLPSAPSSPPAADRVAWIDVARGLGMLAIVLGHSELVQHGTEAFRLLFSFHVPLFFLLSGLMLSPQRPWLQQVRSRARSLLWPYAVVSVAVAGMTTLKTLLAGGPWLVTATTLLAHVAWGGAPRLQWPTLWFIPHLFLASLLALALLRALAHTAPRQGTRPGVQAAVGVALLWAGLVALHTGWPGTPWPWGADLLPATVGLILIGHSLRQRLLSAPLPLWVGLACAVGFALLHLLWDEVLDLNLRQAGDPLRVAAQALLGSGAWVALAQLLCRGACAKRWLVRSLAALGTGSLYVLLLHAWVLVVAFRGLQPLGLVLAHGLALGLACLLPLMLWRLSQHLPVLAWVMGQAPRQSSQPK